MSVLTNVCVAMAHLGLRARLYIGAYLAGTRPVRLLTIYYLHGFPSKPSTAAWEPLGVAK